MVENKFAEKLDQSKLEHYFFSDGAPILFFYFCDESERNSMEDIFPESSEYYVDLDAEISCFYVDSILSFNQLEVILSDSKIDLEVIREKHRQRTELQ